MKIVQGAVALLFLCVALAVAGGPGFNRVENLKASIQAPEYPTNAYYGVSYICVVWTAERFKQYANAHITSIKDFNDQSISHHGWMTTLPANSFYFSAGQILENPEDGKIYDDCLGVAGGFQTIFPQQADLANLNTLSTDSDSSTANGYRLGFDVHSNNYEEWIVAQIHVHNPDHVPGLTTDIHYQVKLTSVTPERKAGWLSGGLYPFKPIDMNEDGTYVLTSTALPATTDISLVADASDFVQCEHYCPLENPVHYDNRFEGRAENSGVTSMLIEGGYVHAHSKQHRVTFEVLRANGEVELIYECDDCGHHNENPDAWKWFDTPVVFGIGDGIRTTCTYKRHGNDTAPIDFGFGASDEMCLAFFVVSYTEDAAVEPLWLPTGGFCDTFHNEGYPNQQLSIPDLYAGLCNIPTCAADCVCNPYFCNFF